MMETDLAIYVDKVVCRPILVVEGIPYCIVVVHCHRVGDAEVMDGFLYICLIFFEWKLGRMNPDDDQTTVFVLLGPCLYIWERAQTIDAGVGPEVDNDNLTF